MPPRFPGSRQSYRPAPGGPDRVRATQPPAASDAVPAPRSSERPPRSQSDSRTRHLSRLSPLPDAFNPLGKKVRKPFAGFHSDDGHPSSNATASILRFTRINSPQRGINPGDLFLGGSDVSRSMSEPAPNNPGSDADQRATVFSCVPLCSKLGSNRHPKLRKKFF